MLIVVLREERHKIFEPVYAKEAATINLECLAFKQVLKQLVDDFLIKLYCTRGALSKLFNELVELVNCFVIDFVLSLSA